MDADTAGAPFVAETESPGVKRFDDGALESYESWVAFAERAVELTRIEIRRRLDDAARTA